MWSQRDLSMKGRITVIKSLILPQILYISANLGVPEWFVSKVNSKLYHFLWSAKMDKVKRMTVIDKIEKGGLKMIDLESMIQAQRVMWVKRFFKQSIEAGWTYYFTHLCSRLKLNPLDLFKCDMHPEFLKLKWPLFYHQMLFAWFHYKSCVNRLSPWDIRRKLLVYNQNILIQNQYISGAYLHWFQVGIRQIHDLFDYKGHPYTAKFLERKYSTKIDILSHNSVISAIPDDWKKSIKTIPIHDMAINYEEMPTALINNEPIPITLISNQNVYWCMVDTIAQAPISQRAWYLLFGSGIEWSRIFRIPYDVTFDTRIQSFQYKILLRIFPCNWYVSKFDHTVEKNCLICNQVTDDISHFFYDCKMCTHFWDKIRHWMNDNFIDIDSNQEICRKNVVLGNLSNKEHFYEINFIILYSKYFIYLKKKTNSHYLNFNEFLNMLLSKLKVHVMIAQQKGNIPFIQKMCTLSSILGAK